ncbi:hypothetical protein L596_014508 [Steinernema carpocapsae]|uniref:CD36 family protein n=1 Tax=Steinernema carpocapsae TaxID=34508 RepID=A0A4U5NCN7_STECR|nr:hypothetical protein L596_014508 [Steinernema carpocapsae]
MRLCLKILVGLVLAALLIFGLVLLIAFPLGIFPVLIKQRMVLEQTAKNVWNQVSGYWQRLPVDSHYDFYMFDTKNPDENLYLGEKLSVQEKGPYSFRETEVKPNADIEFLDGGNEVKYKNYRRWVFDPENSCADCKDDDYFMLPNAAYMAVSNLGKENEKSILPYQRKLLDFVLVALGEYPFRSVPMMGVLFKGYTDPLIDLLNSDFYKHDLPEWFGKKTMADILGFSPPDIKYIGYFPRYNNTNDEDYVVKTGKDDAKNFNSLMEWAGNDSLSWWTGDDGVLDKYANELQGMSDGSFNKPFPSKSDTYRIFRSFSCRTYPMKYEKDDTVQGINGYVFRVSPDAYNTELTINKGYKYKNPFNKDYFPGWPCSTEIPDPKNITECLSVNCKNPENYCKPCCKPTIYGKVPFPNGLMELKCFPGRNKKVPIPMMISPPHFLESPPEVYNSIVGLKPNREHHNTGHFTLQTYTGNAIDAKFRLQLSMPIYQDGDLSGLNQARSSMVPCFWLEVRVSLLSNVVNFLWTNTTVIPKVILGVGVGLVALSCIFGALFAFCLLRNRGRRGQSSDFTEFERFTTPVSRPKSWIEQY